jgi:VIT1/CCC1 family predicted Fe2+/Mn2+ transporter
MFRGGRNLTRGVLFVLAVFLSVSALAWFGAAQSQSNTESRRREFLQHLIAAAVERTHHVVR